MRSLLLDNGMTKETLKNLLNNVTQFRQYN